MDSKRKRTDISSENLPAQIPRKEIFDSSLFKNLCEDPDLIKFAMKNCTGHPAYDLAMQQLDNLFSFGTYDEDAYVSAAKQHVTPELMASFEVFKKTTLMQKYPTLKEEVARLRAHPANKRIGDGVLIDKNLVLEIAKEQVVALYTTSADISGPDKKEEPTGDEVEYIVRRAATTTDLVALKEALETSPDKNRKDNEGRTALIIACSLGKLECVEILLEAGVDVNARDKSDDTALHYAVANVKNECVELLLKHGADITLRNREGLTPIEAAKVTNQSEELLKLFQMHMLRTSNQVCLDTHT